MGLWFCTSVCLTVTSLHVSLPGIVARFALINMLGVMSWSNRVRVCSGNLTSQKHSEEVVYLLIYFFCVCVCVCVGPSCGPAQLYEHRCSVWACQTDRWNWQQHAASVHHHHQEGAAVSDIHSLILLVSTKPDRVKVVSLSCSLWSFFSTCSSFCAALSLDCIVLWHDRFLVHCRLI